MRLWPVAVSLVLAGCASSLEAPEEDTTVTGPTSGTPGATTPTTPTEPPPMLGERGETVVERFLFASNHSLHFTFNATDALPEERLKEAFTGVAFYAEQDSVALLKPWAASPARHAYEATQEIDITIRLVADQPAVTATKPVQFAPVGGWLGTADRWAVFWGASDAPDTLEAGKVYVVHAKVRPPAGGLFVREGESLALYTFLGYQTADNSPLSYVVGGVDSPSSVSMPHVHFNVSAPIASVILDKSGDIAPNPTLEGERNPQPVEFAFDVPPDTAYVVAEVTGGPKTPGRYDVDLKLKGGSEELGASTGPGAHEVVVLGPTALAKAGGKLIARITGSGNSGGTFHIVVTAYGR